MTSSLRWAAVLVALALIAVVGFAVPRPPIRLRHRRRVAVRAAPRPTDSPRTSNGATPSASPGVVGPLGGGLILAHECRRGRCARGLWLGRRHRRANAARDAASETPLLASLQPPVGCRPQACVDRRWTRREPREVPRQPHGGRPRHHGRLLPSQVPEGRRPRLPWLGRCRRRAIGSPAVAWSMSPPGSAAVDDAICRLRCRSRDRVGSSSMPSGTQLLQWIAPWSPDGIGPTRSPVAARRNNAERPDGPTELRSSSRAPAHRASRWRAGARPARCHWERRSAVRPGHLTDRPSPSWHDECRARRAASELLRVDQPADRGCRQRPALRRSQETSLEVGPPAWSPDGRRIAFSDRGWHLRHRHVMAARRWSGSADGSRRPLVARQPSGCLLTLGTRDGARSG